MTTRIAELKSLFLQKGWQLCVAESVTVGRLQALLGSVSGASDFFVGGITTYNLEQKVRHLGVAREEAERTDCVSPLVCQQMARGACALFDAPIAIATTGYAEPYAERNVTTPWAHISIWESVTGTELAGVRVEATRVKPRPSTDSDFRQASQQFYAEAALNALWDCLQG